MAADSQFARISRLVSFVAGGMAGDAITKIHSLATRKLPRPARGGDVALRSVFGQPASAFVRRISRRKRRPPPRQRRPLRLSLVEHNVCLPPFLFLALAVLAASKLAGSRR